MKTTRFIIGFIISVFVIWLIAIAIFSCKPCILDLVFSVFLSNKMHDL